MEWESRAFDPETASPAEWAAFHALEEARFAEMEDPPRAQTRREREDWFRTPFPDVVRRCELALVADRLVGRLLLFEVPAKSRVSAHGALLRSHCRRGIGTAWLRTLLAAAETAGAATVASHSSEADGRAFLERRGFAGTRRHATTRLDLAALDAALLDRWIAALANRAPGVRLEVHRDDLPDPLVGEFVRLTVAASADIPTADGGRDPDQVRRRILRSRERGVLRDVVFARAPDGAVVGVTEITLRDAADATASQGLTGVLRAWRGRGLAKALKAAAIRHLREARPGVAALETTNADDNAAIRAINAALGFRRKSELVEYEIATADLAARLAAGGKDVTCDER